MENEKQLIIISSKEENKIIDTKNALEVEKKSMQVKSTYKKLMPDPRL